jgi:Nucleotidyltransferase domain.
MQQGVYLTVAEVATELNMSPDGAYKIIKRGKLQAVRRSERGIRVSMVALDAYRRRLQCDGMKAPFVAEAGAERDGSRVGSLDRRRIASEVARDLRDVYGERLSDVVMYGSSARGDAQPESDIDLLVVLDEVPSRQRELTRMSDVLWRHSLENDTVVAEIPVSEFEYRELADPLLARVRAEGISVA